MSIVPVVSAVNGAARETSVSVGNSEAVCESAGHDSRHEPSHVETIGGLFVLLGWAVFFAIGIAFPSKFYQALLADGRGSFFETVGSLFMFFISTTATNVAILCCLAALLGELGRRTRIDGVTSRARYHRGDYVASVTRGFLGYLAVVSGLVIIGNGISVVQMPSQDQYIRLAAIVSLLGFLAGYNPSLIRLVQNRINTTLKIEQTTEDGTETTVRGEFSGDGLEAHISTPPAVPSGTAIGSTVGSAVGATVSGAVADDSSVRNGPRRK